MASMSGPAGATANDIRNEDLLALQAYVTAKDSTQYAHLAKGTIVLDLTHSNLKQRHAEIRFDLHDTVGTLRAKIHQKTGTPPPFQHLQLLSGGRILHETPPESDERRMLGYYSLASGMTCHCVDLNPHSGSLGGQYEDVSLVEKYRMSDEEYDRRRGTLREWSREQKAKDPTFNLARHAREHRELVEARNNARAGVPLPVGFEFDGDGNVVRVEAEGNSASADDRNASPSEEGSDDVPGQESVNGIEVGMRCEVSPGGRRGEVAFVGIVPEIGTGGHWVGVVFDEPVGKTDGTAVGKKGGKKKRYFDAPAPNRGGFVRGKNVEVGDFPERDILDELDSSDSENEL